MHNKVSISANTEGIRLMHPWIGMCIISTCACPSSCTCCKNGGDENNMTSHCFVLLLVKYSAGYLHDCKVSLPCWIQSGVTVFVSDWPQVYCPIRGT